MKLNLSVLLEDLKEYDLSAQLRMNRLRPALDFAVLYDPETSLKTNIVYIIEASQLNNIELSHLTYAPCFLCIGKPSDSYLNSDVCNVVWIAKQISPSSLLIETSERFNFYTQWHLSMQNAIARHLPLRVLGELSSEVFKKPIWLYDRHYQTIFSTVDERYYSLSEGYTKHDDMTPWPLWEVNAWKDGGYIDIEYIQGLTKPYILPKTELFNYQALACNIFIGEEYAATITIDEIGTEFTDRDYFLLAQFATILSQGFKRENKINISTSMDLTEKIDSLLRREQVSYSSLSSSLKTIGWDVHDPYTCMVAHAANELYSDDMLAVTAAKTSNDLPGVVYAIGDQEIVFIINTRRTQGSRLEIVDTLTQRLYERRYQTTVGVSTVFSDFSNLYHFCRQAREAVAMGECASKQKGRLYYFEDYMLDFIIDKCKTQILPETLAPEGLMNLIDYDRNNNADLVLILKTYLENNMQVAETSRQLYMHRNTLINKLKKMELALGLDLDDADTRLLIQIALKIIDS